MKVQGVFAVKRIIGHVDSQKRRLYAIAFLAFAAGYVLYSHIEVTRFGMPLPVFTGLLYMSMIVFATAVSTYFLPKLARVTDAVAVTRLGFAVWVAGTQSYEVAASPLIGATIVIGGAMVLLQLRSWATLAVQSMRAATAVDQPVPVWVGAQRRA